MSALARALATAGAGPGARGASRGRDFRRSVARATASDEGDESPKAPDRASGGGARVSRRRPPRAGSSSAGASASSPAASPVRSVRRRSSSDRGRMRSDAEKASALKSMREKAAAPRARALRDKIADACARDDYKDARASYVEALALEDAPVPLAVFEDMLALCDRLRMPGSAEGVFIDSLAAGHAPTQETCWALVQTFERAGEGTRAEKVLAYMESRGMSA